MRIQLLDPITSENLVVDEGESIDVEGPLLDFTGSTVEKDNISSVTLYLYDETSQSVINSRNNVSILSSVATDGTLTLQLEELDNAIVSGTLTRNEQESHVARITYVFDDGVEDRTAINEYTYSVRKK